MKNYFKLFILLMCLGFFSCSSDDDSGDGGGTGGGGVTTQATYRITFTTNFTVDTHPTDYPNDASFGKVFLMAHGVGENLFSIGNIASDGLKLYAETGDLSGLTSEYPGSNVTVITGNSDVGTSTTVTFDIVATPTKTRISFVSKISPSPDWFVGVSSFDLVASDGVSLIDSASRRLYPLDAGSDSGSTYESPDSPEPGPIEQIQGPPFSSGTVASTQIGTFSIERIN